MKEWFHFMKVLLSQGCRVGQRIEQTAKGSPSFISEPAFDQQCTFVTKMHCSELNLRFWNLPVWWRLKTSETHNWSFFFFLLQHWAFRYQVFTILHSFLILSDTPRKAQLRKENHTGAAIKENDYINNKKRQWRMYICSKLTEAVSFNPTESHHIEVIRWD